MNPVTEPRPVATRVRCIHCGLPVPKGLVEPGSDRQFCCNACRTAWTAINSTGMSEYYALRERLGGDAQPAKSDGGQYEEFSDAGFRARHIQTDPQGIERCELYLEGVHCAACVWLVERTPMVIDGLVESRLDLGRAVVSLAWDPARADLSTIAQTLDHFGYRAHPAGRSSQLRARREADREALIRIAIAGALAGNAMLLAIALYAGMFEGMDEGIRFGFRMLSAALGTASVLWPGRVFFRGALGAIRARTWHLDMPIALALSIGLVAGLVNAIRNSGEIYFDSISLLVFLLLCGRWFQQRGHRTAADALDLLFALTPSAAHVVDDAGTVVEMAIDSVEPGMTVEVRAGEACPVDGVIISGMTTLDESILTGESRPVRAGQGDRLAAGTVNLSAPIRVIAEAVGDKTRLGMVMRDIERHAREHTPVVGQADRLAGWFIACVVMLAGVTFLIWARSGVEAAFAHATALLIVSCPCALALATPLVTAVAIGRAAKMGMLIKGADEFESVVRPGVVLFDKTGTLTIGRFTKLDWIGDRQLESKVAALEAGSMHPIARLLAERDPAREPVQHHVEAVDHRVGLGVVGMVDGHRLAAGSLELMHALGVKPNHDLEQQAEARAKLGHTVVFVAQDGTLAAVAVLGDELRSESASTVDRLRSAGWRVGIVSGDRQDVVDAVADTLGIEPEMAHGGMSPTAKAECVERHKKNSPVVMVGDGVNDASALVRASFGVAVRGGAEASLAAAHAYFLRPDLGLLPDLIRGAGRTVAAIKLCLGVSLGYNVIAAGLAMAGVLSPLVAAVLMPVSSLTVLGLALHARTFEAPESSR